MGSRALAALAGLTLLLASQASAVGPLHPLPIECDWAAGGDSYLEYTGLSWYGDAFPDCFSPTYWNGVGHRDVIGPVLQEDEAAVTSDGTSVMLAVSMSFYVPPDFIWARGEVSMSGRGYFRVPAPAGRLTGLSPATLTFEVARSGSSEDAGVGAYVRGPGVEVGPPSGEDGVHTIDTWLVPGETYQVVMSGSARFETTDSFSGSVRVSVAAPEPARPLLLLVGGAALALRALRPARS